MKSEKNILIAFLLNLSFSLLEFLGGIFTNSVAILSDSVHDMGDAISIGISYILEKKSNKQPDKTYTYGYLRYSVIGSVVTTCILLIGSVLVTINAAGRLLNPQEIHYDGMIVLATIGVAVNGLAVHFTRQGESLNQKAVNLHMLEDVLGWGAVLIGAIVMRFTRFVYIDPILSICIAVYIFAHAFSHLKKSLDLFLLKIPKDVDLDVIECRVKEVNGVINVHHMHVWSMDGSRHYATLHVVADGAPVIVKAAVREVLYHCGITHATLELETENEHCNEVRCRTHMERDRHHCHH